MYKDKLFKNECLPIVLELLYINIKWIIIFCILHKE